jgi:hypothetical protein
LTFRDSQGRLVRFPHERLNHILERHSEMAGMEWAIRETLALPDASLPSVRNPTNVVEYYRWFTDTNGSGKYVRVVVRYSQQDAFVLTAHFTRRIPRRGA